MYDPSLSLRLLNGAPAASSGVGGRGVQPSSPAAVRSGSPSKVTFPTPGAVVRLPFASWMVNVRALRRTVSEVSFGRLARVGKFS